MHCCLKLTILVTFVFSFLFFFYYGGFDLNPKSDGLIFKIEDDICEQDLAVDATLCIEINVKENDE